MSFLALRERGQLNGRFGWSIFGWMLNLQGSLLGLQRWCWVMSRGAEKLGASAPIVVRRYLKQVVEVEWLN
jgi:hypothetical protein